MYEFLNLNVYVKEKLQQNRFKIPAINNWSWMVNLHGPKKCFIWETFQCQSKTTLSDLLCSISIYTLSDLGVLSNLIGSLSLANEHYSPPTE